jgi:hypothetical protein
VGDVLMHRVIEQGYEFAKQGPVKAGSAAPATSG